MGNELGWFWSNDRCKTECTTAEFGFISQQTCDAKYKDYILPANCPSCPVCPTVTTTTPTGTGQVMVETFQYNPFVTKKW